MERERSDLEYENFVMQLKLERIKDLLEGTDLDIPDRESWEQMREMGIQYAQWEEGFKEFINTPQECPECGLSSSYRYLGGLRSSTKLIFGCPNNHELRFNYGNFLREGEDSETSGIRPASRAERHSPGKNIR